MYSDDKPQVKAAKVSGVSRAEAAEAKRRRRERLDWFRAHPGLQHHPVACICSSCDDQRNCGSERAMSINQVATILEVWHGGIPYNAPPMPRCSASYDCSNGMGEHSHTQRISDQPFSIHWTNWIKYHMTDPPTLVVHVYGRSK